VQRDLLALEVPVQLRPRLLLPEHRCWRAQVVSQPQLQALLPSSPAQPHPRLLRRQR
jgi:hypothetical protein